MWQDIEQQLIALETIDIVRGWHKQIAGRDLSFRRANEIASAARQGREYLRNASMSAHSVRSLLTYYGNAALARALVLLLRQGAGEESLSRGHGLETVGWSDALSPDLAKALTAVGQLRIRPSAGLFTDLLRETKNVLCVHARSSAVDWRLPYPDPGSDFEFTLEDLSTRLPDVSGQSPHSFESIRVVAVNTLSFTTESGFTAQIQGALPHTLEKAYVGDGYEVVAAGSGTMQIRCAAARCENAMPQLIHGYVRKLFGTIPSLHLCEPFPGGVRLSQLGVTFALSYLLGMLARYFPTHWVALQSGATGDRMWPTIFAAQRYVETAFPELVLEFVADKVATSEGSAESQ